jgi:hypothetical protein
MTIRRLEQNKIQQCLVYADDVNILGGKKDIIKKNKETTFHARKKVGM